MKWCVFMWVTVCVFVGSWWTACATRAKENWPQFRGPATQASISGLLQQPSTHHVAKAFGLLVDFLQHEVVVPAFFRGRDIPLDLVDGAPHLDLFHVEDAVALGGENRTIAVAGSAFSGGTVRLPSIR